VEPENESRSRRHQLEVHTQKGTSEVRLQKEQNQVVRDLVRTERSILHWSRILADLKHEQTRAVQPPLWPEEEAREEN
jgi:hypothetical protein